MKIFKKILIVTSFVFFIMSMSTNAFASDDFVITTNGNASIEVAPNVATLTIGVETREATSKLALDKNSSIINNIVNYLNSIGISSDDYETLNFYTYPDYRYNDDGTSTVLGTYVSNSLQVKVRDFNLISDIINTSLELGANNISNIQYSVDDDDATYHEALQKAVVNAINKGYAMGNAVGKTDLTVTSITETSYNNSYGAYMSYGESSGTMNMGKGDTADVDVPVKPSTVTIYAEVQVTLE